jgi:hypothetical protein
MTTKNRDLPSSSGLERCGFTTVNGKTWRGQIEAGLCHALPVSALVQRLDSPAENCPDAQEAASDWATDRT